MSVRYGGQSMYAPLRTVIVRAPDGAFGSADPLRWNYTAPIDLARAQAEHAALVAVLERSGCSVIHHGVALPDHADAIFVHDPVLITERGAILLRMGKPLRRGEEEAMGHSLQLIGVPIIARLTGDALAESGDMLWLDERTLVIGVGFRTNREGVAQIRSALPDIEVIPVDLPYFMGSAACLHLTSSISLLDHDLAVVHLPLLAVRLYQLLIERRMHLVEVPEFEFSSMGPNVLAIAPRQCLALRGNPITKQRLEAAGCHVETYVGDELSMKAEGGATCLTKSVLRAR